MQLNTTAKQEKGERGESIAAWYVQKKGYQVLQQHFTSRFGEIDLIARDGEQYVFIEVKYRVGENCGLPEEAVTESKMQKLFRAISAYVSQRKIDNYRIDVVAIVENKTARKVTVRLHKAVCADFNIGY